jgi:mono/diheme cytochrome c family protein
MTAKASLNPMVVLLAMASSAAAVGADDISGEAGGIRAVLARYCVSCHGQAEPKGDLSLASLDQRALIEAPAVWSRIRERLSAGEMPPRGEAQPTAEERARLIAFGEGVVARHSIGGRPDPGPLNPRRLNVREHRNVFRDLAVSPDRAEPRRASYAARPDGSTNLYHAIIPPPEHPCEFVTRILPQDTRDGGFDTVGENLSIPPFLMEKYFRASNALMNDCFSLKGKDEHGRYRWRLREAIEKAEQGPLPRGVNTRREAVVAILRDFATRAFRRPVTTEETGKYAALFDASQARGESFETSIRSALEAMLVSPRFAILWSDGGPIDATLDGELPARQVGVRPLNDYELASRLAIFLWSSVPDRELWQLAADGRLQDDEVLQQQVRRMLGDRRITDGLHSGFLCQWLQLDQLDRNAPDAERYPEYFQNNLAELMSQELLLFADAILVEDRGILEFIDADWGFVCHPLAQHYGIENFPGKKPPSNAAPPWYRVTFTSGRRGGLLTLGKVLTGTSQPARTSPVHRGKWVLETILGAPPPPPPPEVDNVLKEATADGKQNLTVPQLLAKHRDNPACYACHQRIDPLGMAFESFDPVGRWRDQDQGHAIDTRGTLVDGRQFDGIVELKALLISRKDEFARCFVEQMLTYALGRKLEFYDEPTIDKISRAVADDGYKFSRVVVEVALSYPFRQCRTYSPAAPVSVE